MTGLAVSATQLGLVSTERGRFQEATVVRLGPQGKECYLKPRDMLQNTEAVIRRYIDAARDANLRWPAADTLLRISQ